MKATHICLMMMAIALVACSGGGQSNASEGLQEEVRLETYQMPDDLLASERELKLSELADSVGYVPLETKPECAGGKVRPFPVQESSVLCDGRLFQDRVCLFR